MLLKSMRSDNAIRDFLKAFMVLFFVFIQSLAHADDCLKADPIRLQAIALVESAMKNDMTSIDGFNLSDVLDKIGRVCVINMTTMRVREGTRSGGYYDSFLKSEGVARLDRNAIAAAPEESRAPLVLHEMLGAARYSDREFSFSMQILYAGKKFSASHKFVNTLIAGRNPEIFYAGGSGTSVGGGGDPWLVFAKILAIDGINDLEAQGRETSEDVQLSDMLQIIFDADFDFYNEAHVIRAGIVNKIYEVPDRNMKIAGACATLEIRSDWLRSADPKVALDLIFQAVRSIIKANVSRQTLCQPVESWLRLGQPMRQ